jgi:hypothetical protein
MLISSGFGVHDSHTGSARIRAGDPQPTASLFNDLKASVHAVVLSDRTTNAVQNRRVRSACVSELKCCS